jgi:hypothetical protein
MKKCHLTEPKIVAGVSETEEVKLLRSLRACSKHLLKSGEGAVATVSLLEHAWYPVGSRVANVNLTAEVKESHQSMVPTALETLARIESDVLERGVLIAKIRQDLTQREAHRAHNQLLRQMGLEEIDDRAEPTDDEDDDS